MDLPTAQDHVEDVEGITKTGPVKSPKHVKQDAREAAALRENLLRRKSQVRGRQNKAEPPSD